MSLTVATTAGPRDVATAAPGRLLLRWWFPKASTPHCALQARALLASWGALTERGVDVVGLSFDTVADLTRWSAELGVPYPLAHAGVGLADHLGAARAPGDPWREAIPRRVFDVVDEHGDVLERHDVTDAAEFLTQVLNVLEGWQR